MVHIDRSGLPDAGLSVQAMRRGCALALIAGLLLLPATARADLATGSCAPAASGPCTPAGQGAGAIPGQAAPTSATAAFTDLSGYPWAAAAIDALSSQRVLLGIGAGRFDPAGDVTRAQFAALAERLLQLPPSCVPGALQAVAPAFWGYPPLTCVVPTFPDVPAGSWEYGAVVAAGPYMALPCGRPSGCPFEPALPVDRQDAAVFLARILAAQGRVAVLAPGAAAAVLAAVPDAAAISTASGSSEYVATALHAGILRGFPDGTFRGQDLVTRAQVAVIAYRVEQTLSTP
jgi:hypothetical protein